MVAGVEDEGCERLVESEVDLVVAVAGVDPPGALEEVVEREVGRWGEGLLCAAGAADAIEPEHARLAVDVAAADEIPGAVALEDLPGVDTAPLVLAAGERVVLDLDRLGAGDGEPQGLERFLGLGARTVDRGELERPRGFFGQRGGGVELELELGQALVQRLVAP